MPYLADRDNEQLGPKNIGKYWMEAVNRLQLSRKQNQKTILGRGFAKSGIWPFNPEVHLDEYLLPQMPAWGFSRAALRS